MWFPQSAGALDPSERSLPTTLPQALTFFHSAIQEAIEATKHLLVFFDIRQRTINAQSIICVYIYINFPVYFLSSEHARLIETRIHGPFTHPRAIVASSAVFLWSVEGMQSTLRCPGQG